MTLEVIRLRALAKVGADPGPMKYGTGILTMHPRVSQGIRYKKTGTDIMNAETNLPPPVS